MLSLTGRGRDAILAFRRCDQIDPTPWMHDYFAGATFISLQMYPLAHKAFSDACARDLGKTTDACKWASYEDRTLLRTAEGWADMLFRRNTGAAAINKSLDEPGRLGSYWAQKAH